MSIRCPRCGREYDVTVFQFGRNVKCACGEIVDALKPQEERIGGMGGGKMIDSYSFGSVTIDGKIYTSDVIIYPDRIDSDWWRKQGHSLCVEDIEEVLAEKPEVIIIGCGASGAMSIPWETRDWIESLGIELIAQNTSEAVATHNELCSKKKVITCLHLTC